MVLHKNMVEEVVELFNSLSTNVPLVYPLKTSENFRFSDFSRGIEGENSLEVM